jgi:DNA-binding NarL/FixJ family response regulator
MGHQWVEDDMPQASVAGIQQTLADVTAVAQQLPPTGPLAFNAMHVSLTQRSVYRSGMASSLLVSASVLEALVRTGLIRWTSRGIGVDTFILVASLPQVEPDWTMLESLSPRERAVLRCIADGLTNREISRQLGLALATVKRYITSLYGKLQITSRTEAIQLARMERG